jgi:hypothetical protein
MATVAEMVARLEEEEKGAKAKGGVSPVVVTMVGAEVDLEEDSAVR